MKTKYDRFAWEGATWHAPSTVNSSKNERRRTSRRARKHFTSLYTPTMWEEKQLQENQYLKSHFLIFLTSISVLNSRVRDMPIPWGRGWAEGFGNRGSHWRDTPDWYTWLAPDLTPNMTPIRLRNHLQMRAKKMGLKKTPDTQIDQTNKENWNTQQKHVFSYEPGRVYGKNPDPHIHSKQKLILYIIW